jgi:hypothetical protein
MKKKYYININIMVNYKLKYLKYKLKYQKLKGGMEAIDYDPQNFDFDGLEVPANTTQPAQIQQQSAAPLVQLLPAANNSIRRSNYCIDYNFTTNNSLLSVFNSEPISIFRNWLIDSVRKMTNLQSGVLRLFNVVLHKNNDNSMDVSLKKSMENPNLQRTPSDHVVYNISQVSESYFNQLTTNQDRFNEFRILLQNYLIELISKSHLDINELFSDINGNSVELVEISFDVYLNRSSDFAAKFHQDRTSQFKSKFVSLSFENTEIIPGPEIVLRTDMAAGILAPQTLNCKYFRPGIPNNGTILFRDDLLFHASPYNTFLENIDINDPVLNLTNPLSQDPRILQCAYEQGLGNCTNIQFIQKYPTQSLRSCTNPSPYRHTWVEDITRPRRNFIRVWLMPKTIQEYNSGGQEYVNRILLYKLPYPIKDLNVLNVDIHKDCGIFYG